MAKRQINNLRHRVAVAVVALSAISGALTAVSDDGSVRPLKVLAIGNSFSIQMHWAVPPVAENLGRRIDICTMYIGGCSLKRHCANLRKREATPYQIDWTYDNKKANPNVPFLSVLTNQTSKKTGRVTKRANIPQMLRAEKWDVVVIQQASHESWKPETYHPFGDKLVKAVREGAPQAKIVVQETWSYVSFCPRYAKWGIGQTEMYDRLRACYDDFASSYGFDIMPVGTAVQIYRRQLPVRSTDTEVGGDPVGKSPTGDSIHMNADGNYLQALVWVGTLLDLDVTKCSYVPKGVDPARGAIMRTCAAQAVVNRKRPK